MSFVMKSSACLGAFAALASICIRLAAATPSIEIAYCASINTGTTSVNSSIYMSEGRCHDWCNDDGYALAVLQDEDCWCGDYVPDSGDQVDTDKCDTSCPGYPSDYCGGDNLYGYLKLDAAISGTTGGSSTATATSTSASTTSQASSAASTATETVQASATTSSSDTPTSSNDPTISSTSLTSIKSTGTSATSTETTDETTTTKADNTPNVITSVQTVTSDGTVIYQTVTSTAKASALGSSSLSKGAIAGLVVGILAVLVAFGAGAMLYRRHRKNQQRAEAAPLAAALDASHRRGSSTGIMSKAGTISSNGFGLAMEEDMSYGSPSRRMSMKPMDPRLDPKQTFGLYRAASHDSINTIRDDQDYSRRVHEPPRALRVFNPDPTDDS